MSLCNKRASLSNTGHESNRYHGCSLNNGLYVGKNAMGMNESISAYIIYVFVFVIYDFTHIPYI